MPCSDTWGDERKPQPEEAISTVMKAAQCYFILEPYGMVAAQTNPKLIDLRLHASIVSLGLGLKRSIF